MHASLLWIKLLEHLTIKAEIIFHAHYKLALFVQKETLWKEDKYFFPLPFVQSANKLNLKGYKSERTNFSELKTEDIRIKTE